MSISIVDIFKAKKNDADGNYDAVATEYANLDIEWIKKVGNQVISADTSWGNATNDLRNLFVIVKGNLTVDAAKTLTANVRKRGMFIWVNGDCTINGAISMSARGASAAGARLLLNNIGADYEVPAAGANGGAYVQTVGANNRKLGNNGSVGSNGQTGGGASGGAGQADYGYARSGAGAGGSSYSGGSAGGGAGAGIDNAIAVAGTINGGAGGAGICSDTSGDRAAGGGAGNPGGAGANAGYAGGTGTGGLLIIFVTGNITLGASGLISANGINGGSVPSGKDAGGGGGSGGGSVNVFYKGSLTGYESAKLKATGGIGGTVPYTSHGGNGGIGTTRITQIALPNLFAVGGAFLLNLI